MLARGMSDKEASHLLSISVNVYRRHVYNACKRVRLENRTQLIVLYAMWRVVQARK